MADLDVDAWRHDTMPGVEDSLVSALVEEQLGATLG
jgi:hypothetical protein